MCVTVSNFVPMVKPFRRYGRFSMIQDSGRPPFWIYFTPVWATHEEYLVVFFHCAKFGWNRHSIFDKIQVRAMFYELWEL